MNFLKKYSQLEIFEWFYLTILFAVIASEVSYIPRSDLFIGWDTTPHAYLVTKMNEFLMDFKVRGFDENWFLGIPLFYLYPPLAFIAALIPRFLTFGTLTPIESFNIFLFSLPFLLFISSYLAGRKVGGLYGGMIGGGVSLFYLFLPSSLEHQGLGLHAFINIGLFASALALCFLTLLFAEMLASFRIIHCGILLGLIVLTHQLTSIFAFLFFGLFTILSSGNFKKGTISIFLGLLISSWWWIPCLQLLDQSTGRAIGAETDPLLLFFPEFTKDFVDSVLKSFEYERKTSFLAFIPWVSIVSAISLFTVFKTLKNTRVITFVAISIILFCLLPRNFFFQLFSLNIHYYRLAGCFFSCFIIFASIGFSEFFKSIKLKFITLSLLLIGILTISFERFDLMIGNTFDSHQLRTGMLSEYPFGEEALYVESLFKEVNSSGIVLEEYYPKNGIYLGTPHLFSTLLPLLQNKPVGTGLLLESSFCGEFIYESLFGLSRKDARINHLISSNSSFFENTKNDFIAQLFKLGVRYIIAYSYELKRSLNTSSFANKVFEGRLMSIYEVNVPINGLTATIFLEPGDYTAREVFRELFRDKRFKDVIILEGKTDFSALSESERDYFDVILKVINNPYSGGTTNPKLVVSRARSLVMGAKTNEIPSIFGTFGKDALYEILLIKAQKRTSVKFNVVEQGAWYPCFINKDSF